MKAKWKGIVVCFFAISSGIVGMGEITAQQLHVAYPDTLNCDSDTTFFHSDEYANTHYWHLRYLYENVFWLSFAEDNVNQIQDPIRSQKRTEVKYILATFDTR